MAVKFDLSRFDAVEVDPVRNARLPGEDRDALERCGENDPDIAMWSVYLHLKEGGVECIADCATKEDAYFIAEALERAFPDTLRRSQPWCEVQA